MIAQDFSNSKNVTAQTIAAQRSEPPLGVSPAFRLGWDEASRGAPFCPEDYFGYGSLNLRSYVDGFLSVRPDCTPALEMYAQLVPDRGVDVDYAERSIQ